MNLILRNSSKVIGTFLKSITDSSTETTAFLDVHSIGILIGPERLRYRIFEKRERDTSFGKDRENIKNILIDLRDKLD